MHLFLKTIVFFSFLILCNSCKKPDNEPVADFGANYRKINTGEKIKFTDKSKNKPTQWNWIFNGGYPLVSELENPEVLYNTPGIYSVSLTVSNEFGNSSLIKSEYIEVVEFTCGNNVLDIRNNMVYETVSINNRCWFKTNMNIGTMIQNNVSAANNTIIEKYCFNNDEAQCAIYGGLYRWGEMMQYNYGSTNGICPEGFSIATQQEFEELINFAGGYTYAGGNLKQSGTQLWHYPNNNASDAYGFSALPAGYLTNNVFVNTTKNALFWTSSPQGADSAYALFISYNNQLAVDTLMNKFVGGSVRCFK